jgi:hypothetical protein
LKLIALKDLLESYLKKQTQEMILSEESIEIMTLGTCEKIRYQRQ